MKKLKQYFFTGCLLLAPLSVTLWLLFIIAKFIAQTFHVGILPPGLPDFVPLPEWTKSIVVILFEIANFLIGFLFSFLLIIAAGALVRTYIGKRLIKFGESLIDRIPFIRSVYSAVKQLTEAIFMVEKTGKLNKVVLIEYPRKGIYSLGFVTGITVGKIGAILNKKEMLNIFIPSTPNPTTGYYLVVPKEDAIDIDLTAEDAFRLIISGGLAVTEESGESSSGIEKKEK